MSTCPPCEICRHHHFLTDPCWLCPSDHACRRERPDAEPPEEVCRWCGFEKNEHLTTNGTRFRCPARFYEPFIAYTEGDKQQS